VHTRPARGTGHTARALPVPSCAEVVVAAEGVGDALVDGAVLAVDAVGVDLEQDGDAVPGPAGDLGGRDAGVQP
jgi:hypothetical protein